MRPLLFWLLHQHAKQDPVDIAMSDDKDSAADFMSENTGQGMLYPLCHVDKPLSIWNVVETLVLLTGVPESHSVRISRITKATFEDSKMKLVQSGMTLDR